MADENQFTTLEAALNAVDSKLHFVPDDGNAASAILAILTDSGAKSVAYTDEEILVQSGLIDALNDSGLDLIEPPTADSTPGQVDAWTKRLAAADTGISSALGIAEETGSMLLAPRHPDQRAVSLLPVNHVAVLRADQVVPDIEALMRRWQEVGDTNGSAVFVTGPSRTADIEKELVLGVHGPQAVDVILLV
ncbi:lactate utilization protein [bacterium]|nr:lactate utilization protein [bacterium]